MRLLCTTGVLALVASGAWADMTLTILHTNDFHDRFEPISGSGGPCDAEAAAAGECFGGVARLVTAIADAPARPVAMDVLTWFAAIVGVLGMAYRLIDAPAHDWGMAVGGVAVLGVLLPVEVEVDGVEHLAAGGLVGVAAAHAGPCSPAPVRTRPRSTA